MSLYLVTGGAGFIGSYLVRFLLDRDEDVRVLDNFSTGKRENLTEVERRIEVVEGDLNDPAVLSRAVSGVDYVFHEAAIPSVPRSVDEPVESHEANATGTLSVIVYRSGLTKGTGVLSGARRIDVTMSITRIPL